MRIPSNIVGTLRPDVTPGIVSSEPKTRIARAIRLANEVGFHSLHNVLVPDLEINAP